MNRITHHPIDDKPVRYKWWRAALLLATVFLSLTGAVPSEFAADNNTSPERAAASTDSNSKALVATLAPAAQIQAPNAPEYPHIEIPRIDRAVYYWIDRARDVVQRCLVEPSLLADSHEAWQG